MTAPDNPTYQIAGRELVSEADGLRVQILTLGPGEKVPWHCHSVVSDIFICLEGTTVVETRAPRARHELAPGAHCVVPPKTAHEVTGKDGAGCRFNIIQGVGEYDYIPVGGSAGGGGGGSGGEAHQD
jgi:quercetin dioxygenase-like cupin family protein